MPIRKRKDGKGWRVDVRIDGKRVRVGAKTKAEAQAVERALKVEAARVQQSADETEAEDILTIQTAVEDWIIRRRPKRASEAEARVLRQRVVTTFGHMGVKAVRPRHLIDWVAEMESEGLAPRTIRNVYGIARRFFRDLQIREAIESSPAILGREHLPANRDKDPEWRVGAIFTLEEVETILRSERLPDDRRAIYHMAFLTGMRSGEILGLRWRSYVEDQPLPRLTVAFSYDKPTKTGKTRQVPVLPVLQEELRRWKLEGWRVRYGRAPEPDDLMFPSPKYGAEAYRRGDSLYRMWLRDLEAEGLRQRRMHDCRRTFITLCQSRGAAPHLLKWVTHGPEGDVMSLYTTPPWAALCEAVELHPYREAAPPSVDDDLNF